MTTGEGAGWGGLWGWLIGLTLAIPFTGGATAPAAAAPPPGYLPAARLEPVREPATPHGGRTSSASPTTSSNRLEGWSSRVIRRLSQFFAPRIPTLWRKPSAVMVAPF